MPAPSSTTTRSARAPAWRARSVLGSGRRRTRPRRGLGRGGRRPGHLSEGPFELRPRTRSGARRVQSLTGAPMDLAGLQQLLQRVAGARVVAVGDLMVDRFVYGEVARISP